MLTLIAVLFGALLLYAAALAAVGWLLWRRTKPAERALLERIHRLPIRRKLSLALALTRDSRIPLRLRAIPPGLILYLASPLDLIPDFIPVIGFLDDLLVGAVGIGLLLRFTPRDVLDELIGRAELP